MNKPEYISMPDWNLLTKKYSNKKLEKYLLKNYPYQYLLGNVEFHHQQILVNKNVLIPRWETEELVNRVIKKSKNLTNIKALDLCSGSGCVAISISKELNIPVDAIEISRKAIDLAKKSSILNGANVNFIKKNILKDELDNKYNLIVSNPPYVSKEELVDEKIKYEPQKAIYAPNEGLLFYQRIISILPKYVLEKYLIAFEIGQNQGEKIKNIAQKYFPNARIIIEKDLLEKDRYLFIENV